MVQLHVHLSCPDWWRNCALAIHWLMAQLCTCHALTDGATVHLPCTNWRRNCALAMQTSRILQRSQIVLPATCTTAWVDIVLDSQSLGHGFDPGQPGRVYLTGWSDYRKRVRLHEMYLNIFKFDSSFQISSFKFISHAFNLFRNVN